MSKDERIAITNPAEGLLVYQTNDTTGLYLYITGNWKAVSDNLGNHTMTGRLDTRGKRVMGVNFNDGFEIDVHGSTIFYARRQDKILSEVAEKSLAFSSNGGIFSYGQLGIGFKPNDMPTAGAQFMWFPYYGTFRAGGVASNNWATDKIGYYSTAFGIGNVASAYVSFAGGENTRADGKYATTFGRGSIAKTDNSFVIGQYNDTTATNVLFTVGNGTATTVNGTTTVTLRSNAVTVFNGTDASLADNSGYMMVGNIGATNIIFDDNEIIARNNGANAPLYLQNEGGDLYTKGAAYKPGGGAWLAISDGRLKKNITSYNDGLSQLLQINPVHFQYNELSVYDTAKQYIGVIAQELKKVAPYMVEQDTSGTLRVDNSAMVYMLINAAKEQQAQIELLKKENQEIKALLKTLLPKN